MKKRQFKISFLVFLLCFVFVSAKAQNTEALQEDNLLPKIIRTESPVLYFHRSQTFPARKFTLDLEINSNGNVSRAKWVKNECYESYVKDAIKSWQFAPNIISSQTRSLRLVISHPFISKRMKSVLLLIETYNISLKVPIKRLKEWPESLPPSVSLIIGEIKRKQ